MNITKEDVCQYLKDVKKAVEMGRYRLAPRKKNEELYNEYIFSEKKCEEIIFNLNVEDFSNAVFNEHIEYSEEILYIFGKEVQLLPLYGGKEETVTLYIKFNKLRDFYVIVVSFHKQDYPLKYRFR